MIRKGPKGPFRIFGPQFPLLFVNRLAKSTKWENTPNTTDDPLVLVQRVTGVDEQGIECVLLDDRAGIVSPLSALPAVAARVKPRAAKAGVYRDIRIELAAGAFATDNQGLAIRRPIAREGQVLRLEGTLVVKKNVDGSGLAIGVGRGRRTTGDHLMAR